jgi:RNA polymerase sigma factor (TIGR02999 family)
MEWNRGNREALNELLPQVYAELHRMADRQFRLERMDHTLQPTALVHEVYLRLVDQRQCSWESRSEFFGVAAQVMRRVLVDHARRHDAVKRGAGVRPLSLDDVEVVSPVGTTPILVLDRALDRLNNLDPEMAKVIELRAFSGLTVEEVAHVMGVSPSTVKRSWRIAKAWLYRELHAEVSCDG